MKCEIKFYISSVCQKCKSIQKVNKMITDQFCQLCLEENASYDHLMEVFDDNEIPMNLSVIINKYFPWIELKPNDLNSNTICDHCWNITNEFHSLYVKVETAHRELKQQFERNEITLNQTPNSTDEVEIDFKNSKSIIQFDFSESLNSNELNINLSSDKNKLVKNAKEKNTRNSMRVLKSKSERLEWKRKINEFFNLSCSECSVTFTKFADLNVHQQSVHNMRCGFVYCCNKKIHQSKLIEHMKWHLDPESFRCEICQKIYSDSYGLRLHMAYHIPGSKNLQCDVCSKTFSRKSQLTHHFTLAHTKKDNKDHKCNDCGKTFAIKSILQSHIRGVHQNVYRHVCDICAKEFKSKSQYQQHRVSHFESSEKIICDCGSKLKNASSLKAHIRRQHRKSPQTCPECGKMSPNIDALRNHIRYNHVISRQYQCTICNKSFEKNIALKEHMAVHLGTTLYTCPYCPKPFNSRANMHSHRKKMHFLERDRTNTGCYN